MRSLILAAVSMAALTAPIAASAQSWGGDYYRYHGRGAYFSGYPQFQGAERHIGQEIREGQSEGWLDRGEAYNFSQRLQWIRQSEQREFNEHGWQLPNWDQQRIQQSLNQLDRSIDEARDSDRGWNDDDSR